MAGPGSIHGSHFLPSDHQESKAANGIRKEQPEQRHTPGPWPESVGDNGAKGGFDPAALAGKLARFLDRHGAAANQDPTAHRVSEAAGAVGRLLTSGGNAYEASKPLIEVAKAGRAAPLALIVVAVGMIPQLKASLSEFLQASRDLLNAVSDKRPGETVPAYQAKAR